MTTLNPSTTGSASVRGDRAIVLFADIMKEHMHIDGAFVGHIGGDDFFCAAGCSDGGDDCCINVLARIKQITDTFTGTAASFYNEEEVENGLYSAKDRTGQTRDFPLLTVSSAIIRIPAGERTTTSDELSNILAILKKRGKSKP